MRKKFIGAKLITDRKSVVDIACVCYESCSMTDIKELLEELDRTQLERVQAVLDRREAGANDISNPTPEEREILDYANELEKRFAVDLPADRKGDALMLSRDAVRDQIKNLDNANFSIPDPEAEPNAAGFEIDDMPEVASNWDGVEIKEEAEPIGQIEPSFVHPVPLIPFVEVAPSIDADPIVLSAADLAGWNSDRFPPGAETVKEPAGESKADPDPDRMPDNAAQYDLNDLYDTVFNVPESVTLAIAENWHGKGGELQAKLAALILDTSKRMEAASTAQVGEFSDFYIARDYWTADFNARSAAIIQEIGWEINRTADAFEIAGVPKWMLDQKSFSGPRAEERNAIIAGLPTEAGRNILSLDEVSRIAILDLFENDSVVTEREIQAAILRIGLGNRGISSPDVIQAVVEKKDLVRGEYVNKTVSGGKTIYYTTREVAREEKRFIDLIKNGNGKYEPILNVAAGKSWNITDPRLLTEKGHDQREAVFGWLNSRNFASEVRGLAGAGKTTMLSEFIRAAKALTGKDVYVFAPYRTAVKTLIKEGKKEQAKAAEEEGQKWVEELERAGAKIIGSQSGSRSGLTGAQTLAMFLKSKNLQKQVAGQFLVFDEAGLIPVKDMTPALEIAHRGGSRCFFSGDTAQHHPIARGDALDLAERFANLEKFELTELHRFLDPGLKKVVQLLAKKVPEKTAEAFDKLVEMGWVREIKDDAERLQAMITEMGEMISRKTDGINHDSCLLISPTHVSIARVTTEVREWKFREGIMDRATERELTVLAPAKMDGGRKSDAVNYQPGQIIHWHSNDKGWKKDEQYEVSRVGGGKVLVRTCGPDGQATGADRELNLESCKSFEVLEAKKINLAIGDQVRITRNQDQIRRDGKEIDLTNGDLEVVQEFLPDRIIFRSGQEMALTNPADKTRSEPVNNSHFGFDLAYGYVFTSPASQSATEHHQISDEAAKTFRAVSMSQKYVSVSRARWMAITYTDDLPGLRKAIQQDESRLGVHDVLDKEGWRKADPIAPVAPGTKPETTKEPSAGAKDPEREKIEADGDIARKALEAILAHLEEPGKKLAEERQANLASKRAKLDQYNLRQEKDARPWVVKAFEKSQKGFKNERGGEAELVNILMDSLWGIFVACLYTAHKHRAEAEVKRAEREAQKEPPRVEATDQIKEMLALDRRGLGQVYQDVRIKADQEIQQTHDDMRKRGVDIPFSDTREQMFDKKAFDSRVNEQTKAEAATLQKPVSPTAPEAAEIKKPDDPAEKENIKHFVNLETLANALPKTVAGLSRALGPEILRHHDHLRSIFRKEGLGRDVPYKETAAKMRDISLASAPAKNSETRDSNRYRAAAAAVQRAPQRAAEVVRGRDR
jgi:hypothetical protein